MSYDLEIATRWRPGPLEPLLDRLGIRARFEGAFEPDRNVLVTRLGDPERTIDVEGPAEYEPEDLVGDLDESFSAAAGEARWLCGIHLPGGYAEPDDRWVIDLAIELARAGDGAVWDPQAERVVWPDSVSIPSERSPRPEPGRPGHKVVLAWHVSQARALPDLPETLLGLLRRLLPAGLPARFGRTEPYQHRLERDGDAAFVADWSAEAERHALLTWDGRTRAWHGSVVFRPGDGGRLEPDLVISIEGDDAALHDQTAADRLTAALAAIADGLDAVYAEAHVEGTEPEFIRGGVPVAQFRDVVARGWAGLPWDPTWLAWFGRPYADRMHDQLAERMDRETDRGFLIRMGVLATPRGGLRAVFPQLPPELVQEEWFLVSPTDGARISRLRPAIEIPRLDPE